MRTTLAFARAEPARAATPGVNRGRQETTMVESILSSLVCEIVHSFLKKTVQSLRVQLPLEWPRSIAELQFRYGVWKAERKLERMRPRKKMLADGSIQGI